MSGKTIFLVCLLAASFSGKSQTTITGRTIDSEGEPVAFANVLLLNPEDSTLLLGELSDLEGWFAIDASPGLECILNCSFIGFDTYYSDVFSVPGESPMVFGEITLTEGVQLDEVQLVAKKPLYERKIDRMIVNVAASVTSSGMSALEVLEKSPGIIVNRQNNVISLMGKDGVIVMINGKINYQPLESIVQMLDGMSSDNIEKIELITTPPANLDAEGNAGYINIVLKKRSDLGINGNLSASAGIGQGHTGTSNISLNYRKNRVNVFANYSYFLQSQYQEFYNYRKVFLPGSDLESDVLTERDPVDRNHNLRLGIDYELNDKTTIGLLTAAYDNKWTMEAVNFGTIRENSILTDSLALENTERNQWRHFMVNLNLEHRFSESRKFNLNIDRLYYEDENPNTYFTRNFTPSGEFIDAIETRSDKFTPIDINVAQLDYEQSLSDYFSYQLGIKAVISQFTNDVSVEEFQDNTWKSLEQFTNESELEEKIYAAYFSADYKLDEKHSFKFGMRYEFTDSELITDKQGVVVDREFGQVFPSLYYSYRIDERQNLGLSYNRRITRPTFNDMAPFAIFLDPNTYFFGNAALQPAISSNYKADYSYKGYNLSVQYSVEDSTIARFQDFVDLETNEQSFRPVNFSQTKLLTASLSFPVYLTRHWEMQNNFIGSYTQINSFYESEAISIDNYNLNINSTQNFLFTNGITAEISGFYISPGLWGRAKLEPIYGLNLGVQKKFDSGASLRINLRDALNSIVWKGGTDLRDQGFLTDGYFDFSVRTLILSFSTSFGNKKLKASRERSTGSDDVQQRVN